MAILAQQIAVNTTPVLLGTGVGQDHRSIALRNASLPIWVGGPSVDATTGFPVGISDSFSIDLYAGDLLYAIGSAPTTVQVLTNRT